MVTATGLALLNNNRLEKYFNTITQQIKMSIFSNRRNADLAEKIDFHPPSILPKGD